MSLPTWEPGVHEVAENVYAYVHAEARWDICNSGFIVGEEGVFVIDSMMVGRIVEPYLEAMRKVTSKPVRYVVNTHHHLDHSFGNQYFLPAQIISHRKCREVLVERGIDIEQFSRIWPQYKDDWPTVRLTPATITYQDRMVVHFEDRVIELIHPGPAHTYGDTLIYLPDEKILFTGDVAFHYLTPLARDGHVGRWLRVGKRLIDRLDAEKVVPAHGPVGGKEIISKTIRYLNLVRRECRRQFRKGASVKEAAGSVELGEFQYWTERDERLLSNVEVLYEEFRGELPEPSKVGSWL